jgi:hypothetical protein
MRFSYINLGTVDFTVICEALFFQEGLFCLLSIVSYMALFTNVLMINA